MKTVVFRQLTIKNFKQFNGEAVKVLLDRPGVTFLRGRNLEEPALGSNNAGKSTLWGALLWCLYGTTTDGLHNADIIPWDGNGGTTYVILKLDVAGKPHTIQRIANPSKLLLDKVAVGQERVTQLIGMSKPTFLHTVLFGQDKPLFFDLKPKDQMDLFGEVLNLDRWDRRSAKASELATKFTQGQAYLEAALKGLQAQEDEVIKNLAAVQAQSDAWKAEDAKLAESINDEIVREKKQLDKLLDSRSKADLGYESAVVELKVLEKEFNDNLLNLDKARGDLQIENDKRRDLLAEASRIAKELNKFGMDGLCPICGQSIERTKLRARISELKKIRDNVLKEAAEWPTKLTTELCDELRNERDILHDGIQTFKVKTHSWHEDQLKLAPLIAETTARIKYLEERQASRPTNPHRIRIRDLNQRRANLQVDIEANLKNNKILEKKAVRVGRWIKGFKDIRLYMIEDVLQELTLTTASLLDAVGLFGWRVEYTVEKETKSGTLQHALYTLITSPDYAKPVKWGTWSGGVSQRLRLIGALALGQVLLNRAGISTNLQVLDEPTRSLSPEGVDSLCRLLADYARDTDTSVWFIDHHAIEGSAFASSITVVRDKTGARVQ